MAVAGTAVLGGAAVAAGIKMVGLASDALEVKSKMQATFGETLPAVTKNLDAFAAATGGSRFAMREQAADMGALLAPMLGSKQGAADMSVQFTKLAADLGSFNNIPTADALEKIRAGLVGESEPLRSLGVLINDAAVKTEAYTSGIAKQGAALTEVQKVQARANLIMEQTKLAQGDAERTAGSMANQMKALRSSISDTATEIGIKLIPIALEFVQAINAHWPTIEAVINTVFSGIGAAFRTGADVAKWLVDQFQTHRDTIANVWSTVKDVVGAAFRAVAAAAETAWGRAQQSAQQVLNWHRGTLAPAIDNVLTAIQASYDKFGGDVKEPTTRDFGAIGIIVRFQMNQIKNVVELALALIRGDWSQAWTSLKAIVTNALTTARDLVVKAASMIFGAAKAVGAAIVDGIMAFLPQLPGKLLSALSAIPGALAAAASAAFGAAVQIGRQIISGIISGLAGLVGRVASSIAGGVSSAIDWAKNNIGSTAEEAASEALGKPLGEGVIRGFLLGSASLPQKMADRVREGLERAKSVIEASRGELSSAFSDLASAGSEALGKLFGGPTASERKLDALETARQIKEIAERIKEARAELATAQTGGDPEAVKTAQKALADALYEQTRFNLERQAELERQKRDEQLALRQRHFQERLEQLQANLAREGATHQEAHERVTKLFKSFGIDYKAAGRNLGAALAEGLRDSLKEIEDAVAEIGKVLAKHLKGKSPPEKGPLSDIDKWGAPIGRAWASGLAAGAAGGGPMAAGAFAGGGGKGGGTSVVVNVHGSVVGSGGMNELANIIRDRFNEQLRANPRLFATT